VLDRSEPRKQRPSILPLTRQWLLLDVFGRKTQRRTSGALEAAERIDAAALASEWDRLQETLAHAERVETDEPPPSHAPGGWRWS
jgi:hypothetical protein